MLLFRCGIAFVLSSSILLFEAVATAQQAGSLGEVAPTRPAAVPFCDGLAWDTIAPHSPVRESPGPVTMVVTANGPRDLLRVQQGGLVQIDRHGLPVVNLCRLSPSRQAGLIRTLQNVGFSTGPWVPRVDVNDWADVSAVFDGSNHSVRIAIDPAPTSAEQTPALANIRSLRENFLRAATSIEPPRSQGDRLLDEVRRFVAIYNQGRGMPMLHGGRTFEASGFALLQQQQANNELRVLVRWADSEVVDSGPVPPNRAGSGHNAQPSNPVPSVKTQWFVFRSVTGGFQLQRPSTMPARRPRRPPMDYPGAGERGGVEAPVYRARVIAA